MRPYSSHIQPYTSNPRIQAAAGLSKSFGTLPHCRKFGLTHPNPGKRDPQVHMYSRNMIGLQGPRFVYSYHRPTIFLGFPIWGPQSIPPLKLLWKVWMTRGTQSPNGLTMRHVRLRSTRRPETSSIWNSIRLGGTRHLYKQERKRGRPHALNNAARGSAWTPQKGLNDGRAAL